MKHTGLANMSMNATAPIAAAQLLSWARTQLKSRSSTPRLDAELLLCHAWGASRTSLIAHPEREVPAAATRAFRDAIRRRVAGEPIAYIRGEREFYSITLSVSPAVLVPRPETELIVDAVLSMTDANEQFSVLDLGTGSGAIALAIRYERHGAVVTAVDASKRALTVARANAERLGLAVRMIESDWFEALDGERFDFIVCNPPYVETGFLDKGTLDYEPRRALDGGEDGLRDIRPILGKARGYLKKGGMLLLEHGLGQAPAIIEAARAAGLEHLGTERDAAGHERIAIVGAPK